MDKELELVLLRKLREKVAAMFAFTGWEDDCDDEAAKACTEVMEFLLLVEQAEKLLGKKPSE